MQGMTGVFSQAEVEKLLLNIHITWHTGFFTHGSGHETVAVLLPGFAINW